MDPTRAARRPSRVGPRGDRSLAAVLLIFCLASVAPTAAVQTPTPLQRPATIAGRTVLRDSAVALPGVTIETIENATGARVATTQSDNDGQFVLTLVGEGEYRLEARLDGFEPASLVVRLAPSERREIEFELRVAQVTENVSVTGSAAPAAMATSTGAQFRGTAIDLAPLRGDTFQSVLPLTPGVLRAADGRIMMKGGQPTQSSVQVNSATVTDPSTGNIALDLPSAAIESVTVMPYPYAAELGGFSAGVTQIETRRGDDKWRIIPNGFIPRFRVDRDSIWPFRGLRSFTPRLAIGGPLIDNRLHLAQSFTFKHIKTDIESRPQSEYMLLQSFDSFTRVDVATSRHQIITTLALFPQKFDGINLNTFNGPDVAASFRQSGFNVGVAVSSVLSSSRLLETMVNVKRYDARVEGQGETPMVISPQGNSGSFFNEQDRDTFSVQWAQSLSVARSGPSGEHLVKVGLDLLTASYRGSSESRPVDVQRLDGSLAERITFDGPSHQQVDATDAALYLQDRWRAADRVVFDLGLRLERDGVLDRLNLMPRLGAALSLRSESRTVLRGGAGLFYQRTPLNVGAFESFERRTVVRFGADGSSRPTPVTWGHRVDSLATPYASIWNVSVDHRAGSALWLRLNHLRRSGRRELIVDHADARGLLLTSAGRTRYAETEATLRFAPNEAHELIATLVRSHAESDTNAFDAYFGNVRRPLLRPNEFTLADIDVPWRLLVRGWFLLPRTQWTAAPILEIRNGFPYSVVDDRQQFVGARNRGGRFPTLATLDLMLSRRVQIKRWPVRFGVRAFNLLNRFTPRDVQNNIASPAFGSFYNHIRRSLGVTVWFES